MIRELWRSLTGRGEQAQARLTGEEAMKIASRVSPDRPANIASVSIVDGRLVWTTRSSARGTARIVTLDDGSGEVIDIRDFHGR